MLPDVIVGITDASTTLKLLTPCTFPNWSTTDILSEVGPILHVALMCWPVVASRIIHSSSVSSDSRSLSSGSIRSSMIFAKLGFLDKSIAFRIPSLDRSLSKG